MKCPFCGTDHQTVVIMTRSNKDRILRRRKCLKCGKRFWTAETVVNG